MARTLTGEIAQGAQVQTMSLAVTGVETSDSVDMKNGIKPKIFACLLAALTAWMLSLPLAARDTGGYAGSQQCRGCHTAEYDAWQGSHHDLAMQPVNTETVLGNFDDAVFEHRGVTTRFLRRNGKYLVETQGYDGKAHEYELAYTFGAVPLQQYLIGFPDGRYQALTVAWDSRPAQQGGQRWFHLYPDEDIPPGNELHWTAAAHTWNFACAECHSTHLRKGYDPVADTYRTTWSEIDVACEACHGPGTRHVTVAKAAAQGKADYPHDHGLVVQLGGPGEWSLDTGQDNATLVKQATGTAEVELCGRCHARRSQLTQDYVHGQPLANSHRIQLLSDGYYHPDGQILDEVYVYGSFLQSRMHAAGVSCSDCHEPHSLKLKAEGNAVCTRCHAAASYDTSEHHHHPKDSKGADCVECHMPSRRYMVIDPRRDHSLRIPRPDMSTVLGAPNACSQCHVDRSNQWLSAAMTRWYGTDRNPGHQRYARTLHAARIGGPGAAQGLVALAMDASAPGIARATALQELTGYLGPEALPAIQAGLGAQEPLMRRAAVETLRSADAAVRIELVAPLLRDPVRDVRLAAASVLADVRTNDLPDVELRTVLRKAFDEYLAAQRLNADRAESWVNLGGFHFTQGHNEKAEQAYTEARRRDERFVPAYVNQADMYRVLGREDDSERILREGLKAAPDAAAMHYALGLLLIRTGQSEAAIQSLQQAYLLGPEDPRLGYVYGIALESYGQRDRAIEIWEAVIERHPNHHETLNVLSMTLYQADHHARALVHAEKLAALSPADKTRQQVVEMIRRAMMPAR